MEKRKIHEMEDNVRNKSSDESREVVRIGPPYEF